MDGSEPLFLVCRILTRWMCIRIRWTWIRNPAVDNNVMIRFPCLAGRGGKAGRPQGTRCPPNYRHHRPAKRRLALTSRDKGRVELQYLPAKAGRPRGKRCPANYIHHRLVRALTSTNFRRPRIFRVAIPTYQLKAGHPIFPPSYRQHRTAKRRLTLTSRAQGSVDLQYLPYIGGP